MFNLISILEGVVAFTLYLSAEILENIKIVEVRLAVVKVARKITFVLFLILRFSLGVL